MNIKQQTIKAPVTISGVGLHTGQKVNMTFKPAKANHGIKFQRIDLDGQPIVDADVDNVVDLSRGTTLEQGGARINTVEHTMAALAGLEVDNILIELDGPEPPIMDGSAQMFIDALNSQGLEEQGVQRNFFEVPEGIFHRDNNNDVEIAAMPLDDFRLTVMVDYKSPVLGSQHASLNDITKFQNEIADSRTFCFLHELEALFKQGLIKGGDLNNAIVVVDKEVDESELQNLAKLFNQPKVEVNGTGILNNVELRYKNEPARHKLLDLMGDLALLGRPIKAQILAARPGHASNIAFTKKLKRALEAANKEAIPVYDPKVPPLYDVMGIMDMLPHRYPFLMVDKIFHLDSETVCGVKNVSINEPFFQGHFPGKPVMPGVLIVEAIAQVGGILVMNTYEDPENYLTFFLGLDGIKFRKMVGPGDQMIIKCELLAPIRRGLAKMKGYAWVGNSLVAEGVMLASIQPKEQK
ncbi:MAG: bifunctional UDP-3-O-[3-hydroxymyristoyl] N-acetylglucosamine deacetylase/3-hydroxyacyl-ACP dehydratase [Cyclobacteriaceae bacterium]